MVGGAVRDFLLNITPKDTDYVVVGSTPAEMLELGFTQVGASFPVFLKDGAEYALARTERKTGVGYNGFETIYDPSITLEDDLRRRDITINSMAMDLQTNQIIDPYGGCDDLDAKILRHTSEAFAEDPIRVLRTARFAARYGFTIADETLVLMKHIAAELAHVPAERIWAEIEKGLMEDHPEKMFTALMSVDAYRSHAMQPYRGASIEQLSLVKQEHDLSTRFTLISLTFCDQDYDDCCIPNNCARVARAFKRNYKMIKTYWTMLPGDRVMCLDLMHAFNNRSLLDKCLEISSFYTSDARIKLAIDADLQRLSAIDAAAIASSCSTGVKIKEKLFQARLEALSH
jgi:hypothetical protein